MPDPLDPQRFHVMTKSTIRKLIIIAAVFVLFIFPALFWSYYKVALNRPSQMDKEVTFEIKSGEGVPEVGANLYKSGLINSEVLFSIYVYLNRLDRTIQAGVYTIRAGAPLTELVEQFQHGVNDIKITFIEGWRVEEYARQAGSKFEKIDYSEFLTKAKPYEGYLFPDTYYFPKEIREDEMIERLRDTFNNKTEGLFTEAALNRTGLTQSEVVILASIVEREISSPKDRPIVAGLLLARLREGMRLDADATTQYAVAANKLCSSEPVNDICTRPMEEVSQFNWWPKNLTGTDLKYASPFNTRLVAGLPPAPISNPSLSAIESVLNYEETDYTYYLTDKYGNTHYAKTLDEHELNVAQFLQ